MSDQAAELVGQIVGFVVGVLIVFFVFRAIKKRRGPR